MHVEVVKSDKHEVELHLDNATVAEILRVYLHEVGVDFAAWRKEHYSKPFIMRIDSGDKPVKKVVSEAVAAIEKDLAAIMAIVKRK